MEESNNSDNAPRRKLNQADFRRVNVGRLYWGCTRSGIQSEQARKGVTAYTDKVGEMVRDGVGLLISGARGVGKTGAAVVVIKAAILGGFTTYFVTHAELRDLQFQDRVFGDGSDGITVNQRILNAQLLVIDGLDREFQTDRAFGPLQLVRLLTRRNSNKLATVITTRIAREFKEKEEYADLYDALRQSMLPITIVGINLRDTMQRDLESRLFGERKK
jgi:DNA replication protein DnaC